MHEFEQSYRRGCILANVMGMGKTISVLMAIHLSQLIKERDPEPGRYKPTLVIVPNITIESWYIHIKKYFAGLLHPWIYYGSAENVSADNDRSDRVIDSKELGTFMDELMAADKDPKVRGPRSAAFDEHVPEAPSANTFIKPLAAFRDHVRQA